MNSPYRKAWNRVITTITSKRSYRLHLLSLTLFSGAERILNHHEYHNWDNVHPLKEQIKLVGCPRTYIFRQERPIIGPRSMLTSPFLVLNSWKIRRCIRPKLRLCLSYPQKLTPAALQLVLWPRFRSLGHLPAPRFRRIRADLYPHHKCPVERRSSTGLDVFPCLWSKRMYELGSSGVIGTKDVSASLEKPTG